MMDSGLRLMLRQEVKSRQQSSQLLTPQPELSESKWLIVFQQLLDWKFHKESG